MRGTAQLTGELPQIRAPERLQAAVDRTVIQTGQAQQLARDLRIRFAVEGVRGNRARCFINFEQCTMESAPGCAVRAEQRAIDIEQKQSPHSVS
jgi:hypothetical protein